MATNITNLVAGVFIPEVWSRETKKAAESKLVMAKLVKRFDADVKQVGDTIHVPNISNITGTYKVNNTEVAQSVTTESSDTITIDKHGVVRVTIEDLVKTQSAYDLRKEYTSKMGYALGKLVDDDLMGLYTGLSQTIGSTSNNVGLAKSYISGANRVLDAANAPLDDRHLVVEAYGREDLLNIDDFVRYDAAGQGADSNAIISGKLGRIYGVEVHYTEQVPAVTSLCHAMMFHREALALAMQKSIRTQSDYVARELATDVVADVLYGVAEYRDTFAVDVRYGKT